MAEAVREAARRRHGRLSDRRRHACSITARSPTRPGIGLSLAKLNRVIDYPADDLTITVEAGMTIAELAQVSGGAAAAAAGRRCRSPTGRPSAARWPPTPAGPRRYRLRHDARLRARASRPSTARGTAFSGGGRVVKNAAGYNMCRLMTGSLGTLGVITQVTLMVRPLPEASAFVACDVPDFETAEQLLAGLVRTQTAAGGHRTARPVRPARDAIPRLAADAGRRRRRPARVVGFEGRRPRSSGWSTSFAASGGELGVDRADAGAAAADAERLWQLARRTAGRRCEINVLPSARASQLIAELAPMSRTPATVRSMPHAGRRRAVRGISRLPATAAARRRGSLRPRSTAPAADDRAAAPGAAIRPRRRLGSAGRRHAAVMQAIKERFDPDGHPQPRPIHFRMRPMMQSDRRPRQLERSGRNPAAGIDYDLFLRLRPLRAVYVELSDLHRAGRRERRPARPHPTDADGGRRPAPS